MSSSQINTTAASLYLMESSLYQDIPDQPVLSSQMVAVGAFSNSPTQTQNNDSRLSPVILLNSSPDLGLPDVDSVLEGVYLPNKITYKECDKEPPRIDQCRGNSPAEPLVNLILSYTLYSQKVQFPAMGIPLVVLKDKLFRLAHKLDNSPNSDGKIDILKQADTQGNVSIQLFISQHKTYGKNYKRLDTSDTEVKDFFQALRLHPARDAGFVVTMKDPAQQARKEEKRLSISHARVVAKNVKQDQDTTESDIVASILMPSQKRHLADLLKKYTTAHNNSCEGWRIYKPNNLTMVMNLTHSHMVLWSKQLATQDPRVSMENPPDYLPEFVWEDMKQPLASSAPAKEAKIKASNQISPPSAFGVGSSFQTDDSTVEHLVKKVSLMQFMKFAKVPSAKIQDFATKLLDRKIGQQF